MKYFVALLLGSLLTACNKKVEKAQPTSGPISESVYASGIVKSKNQYQVYATANGLLQKVLVKEGDIVKKGEPLFVVQHETSRLNEENSKLASDFATSNLNSDRLSELKGLIETAKAKMLNDSLLLSRQRSLWAQKIGSQVELEQRELAYSSSLNSYQAAILRYNDLNKQLKFSASQSKKLLSISQSIAQDYVIRSQTDGRVYSITKEIGEMVNTQSVLAVVGAENDFLLELQVDENDIARVKLGQRILVTLSSYKGQVFEATVSSIYPIMNERSRTFTIEGLFSKNKPVLYPNLTVESNIIIHSKENALTIPRSFLHGDSMVMTEDKKLRKVVVGLKDYQQAEILQGLQASESIIKPLK